MKGKSSNIAILGAALAAAVATMMYAPSTQAACQSSFYRSTSTSRSIGDYSQLWANIAGRAYIKGTDRSSGDRLDASAQVTSDVRIFGLRKQVAKVIGSAYSYYGDSVGGSIDAYAVGYNIYHRSLSYSLYINRSWDRTFFSASQWFFPGGIPVHVTETAGGSLGFDMYWGLSTTGIGADVIPWAEAHATGTAAVDILVAGFGVTAVVDLVELQLPTEAQLYLSGNHLDWSLRTDGILDLLKGRAYVWAQALFGLIKHEEDIINWNGYTKQWTLYNYSSDTDLCS